MKTDEEVTSTLDLHLTIDKSIDPFIFIVLLCV